MNVIVAGAGPTGLTLGIDERVIDQAINFFAGSGGDGLQPRTLEIFEDLGVLNRVLAQGRSLPIIRVYLDGIFTTERRMAAPLLPTPNIPYPHAWVLGQSQTEAILRDRLASLGVKVELATALTDFVQEETGVTVYLSTDHSARASYLVGADGGSSAVRKILGVGFEGVTDDSIRVLLGDVGADGLDHEYGYWVALGSAPMTGVGLSPLPNTERLSNLARPCPTKIANRPWIPCNRHCMRSMLESR